MRKTFRRGGAGVGRSSCSGSPLAGRGALQLLEDGGGAEDEGDALEGRRMKRARDSRDGVFRAEAERRKRARGKRDRGKSGGGKRESEGRAIGRGIRVRFGAVGLDKVIWALGLEGRRRGLEGIGPGRPGLAAFFLFLK